MDVSYDRDGDVLYVTWRDAERVRKIDREDDVIVRKDADTGDVVGYTVLNFSERDADHGVVHITEDATAQTSSA